MFGRNKVVFLVALIFSVALLVHIVAGSVPPVAAFNYTPAAPILGDVVIFDASASYDPDGGNISSYRWDFGDGTPVITVPEPVATHNYTTFGTYNVTLTVTDDEAKTDTTWQNVTVREYPVASFTYTPGYPIADETVTFDASSSIPRGGTITRYDWDFGDTNSTNVIVPTITHTYASEGNYTVTLTVRDSEGLSDTTWQNVTVRNYPVARFTHSPRRPLVNTTVTFDASSSTPKGGTITRYDWTFGDGNIGTGKIVTHNYTAIGDYNATLTVTDSENLNDTAWTIVQVRNYPVAVFTYSPATPLVGETVTFNASSSSPNGGTIVSYRWDFDDGNVTTVANPVIIHVYQTFGTFNVTLTITDSEDLSDTFWDTIRILIAPVADFAYSPSKPIIDEKVTFNASDSYDPDGSSSIVSYRWDFGDGNVTTVAGAVIKHAYTAEGTYNVSLTVTDDDGLTDTTWKLITVYSFLYVHDVAIISVTPSATEVYVGLTLNITVVAKNEGTAVETFDVTVYYDTTSVGTKTVTSLLPGSERTLTFSFNTVGITPGNYTISAQASEVSGETETTDNTYIYGIIKIKRVGDINGDGCVDMGDVVIVCIAFGSAPVDDPETPWDETSNWNPIADIAPFGNPDDCVDMGDVVLPCIHFGEGVCPE